MALTAYIIFWLDWSLVFYTYALFPILLAMIANTFAGRPGFTSLRASGLDPDAEGRLPTVTMVVAAYNEAAVLGKKLENTELIDYPTDRFELLIGLDGQGDGSAGIVQQWNSGTLGRRSSKRIRCMAFAERRGKISVLNDLMREIDSDIIVMSDANTMFDPDAICKLIAHFDDLRVGCVSGQLILDQEGGVSGEGLYWKYEAWIKKNESRLGFLIGCNGGIFAMRRELYTPLPASTIVEDFVLTLRVLEQGYRVRLEPAARATEPPCSTARAEMVRKIRIGAGGWQALGLNAGLLHPKCGLRAFAFWGHKVLRWLAPCFLIAALGANVALAAAGSPFFAVTLAAQLGGLVCAFLAHRAGESRPLPRLLRPISYFYLMNYALLCGLIKFVFKQQRVTWDRVDRGEQQPVGKIKADTSTETPDVPVAKADPQEVDPLLGKGRDSESLARRN